MRSVLEEYMETGMIGAYQPEMAVLRQNSDGVISVYRDTVYERREDAMLGRRMMEVDGKQFRVTSVFPDDSASTPTQKFLSYIDSELSKESHSA